MCSVMVQRTLVARPIVIGLFITSCLLSIVSWYTTEQGMSLYLASWFALLASLGVQVSLVLVAWLIGITTSKRPLLIAVYVVTAVISISFSYVSLFTWFSANERPQAIERRLYDTLNEAAGKVEETLGASIGEGQKHVLALEEMTEAEKAHGHISRAQDADPYLARVREAVAQEATAYDREGAGAGVRYTAFDRYRKIAAQSVERLQSAQQRLMDFRRTFKPLDPTEKQLREFRAAYDAIPWSDVEVTLHNMHFERPLAPAYADFVDRTASSQEDLMIAFQELFTAPTGRHIFAFTLAAFIDVIVFLLAFASGPFFFGKPEQQWIAAAANIEALDDQIFVRDFLRKLTPSPRGLAKVEAGWLSSGEQQLCLLLAAKNLVISVEEDGKLFYLLDQAIHEQLMESLATKGFPLRASQAGNRL